MNDALHAVSDLRSEWARLRAGWDAARAQWCDGTAAQFEADYWQHWETYLPRIIAETEVLAELLDRALWDE
jgi:hypothetical protein